MSANGKKRDKSFIALLVLIIVCACLMVAAITTLGIGMSNGDLSDDQQSEQTGNRGTVWHKGKGVPGNDVGVEGDYYLDEATGDVYCKSATGWGNVVLNLKGTDGITPEIKGGYWWIGDKNTGVRAEAVLAPEIKPDGYWYFDGVKSDYKAFPTMTSGTEAPDNKNGALGDFYVQKAADGTVTFYQKVKDASTGNIEWKSVVTVEPSVATDVNGAKWFVGTTAPTADNPAGAKVGDFYLDTSKNNIYLMTASGWGSPIGNLHDAPVTQPDTVLYGTVAPDAVTEDGNPELYQALRDAKIGDYYFNNATGEVYQKVANNGDKDDWKDAGFSIKGEDGNKWYHGSGEPTAENPALKDVVPNAGDIYFDEDAHLLYTYGAEGWGKGVPFGTPGGQAQQWHHGTGEPTAVKDSNNGDFYIDQTSGELYQRNDAADGSEHWDDLGIKIQGTAGTPGNKWYHGTLAPTDENNGALKDVVLNEGDIYYDTDDHLLFTYGNDGWDSGISFGAQGTPGTHWYHGESKPSAEDPAGAQNGDYYFDSSSNIIYIKEAGDWTELVDLTPAAPAEPDIRDGIWWIGDRNTGIPATGEKGEDGKTPYIGEGNHWYIDGNDLGPAVGEKGEPGDTPFINDDGYWQIGENVTEFKAEGVDGKNGTVWHSGEGKPVMQATENADEFYTYNVNEGDFYLDVKTGKVYVLESDLESEGTLAWREIATLRDTLQNVHGAWYLNGRPTGLYVSTWRTGEGDPNDAAEPLMGNYGDLYLDTLTGDVYVSNAALGEESEAWTKKLNIKGERGNYLHSGKGKPVPYGEQAIPDEQVPVANAKPGDMYLDTNTGDIYQLQENAWVLLFKTKGDKGDRGSKWFNGTEDPRGTIIEGAVVGDYYFETKHGYIYYLREVTKDAEENVIGQTWALVNEDDPLAGTKWLSGNVDPDKADGDLKTLLDGANDWDVYFNTADKTIWQLTPTGPETSEWQLLGHLTNETDRGTVWYYGTYDPTVKNDQDGFEKATEGHIFGDFYLQTYYPFSGYTGFRIYIFEDDGHLGKWNMHVDMRSEVKEGEFKYEIPNYDALRAFRDSVNGAFEGKQANSYKDSNTGKQTTVTLTGQVTIPEDEKFGMIGEEDTTPFSGIFDGGTEGLFIEGQGLEGPLFGYLDGATIKNLHVKAKLDELTLATFALGDKTSLLTNTYGIAKSAKDTKFENVTLELTNANGTVLVKWDGSGNVSVTVTGNKPASTAEGHRMRATGSADDYLLVIRGEMLELGDAKFTFDHVKFEDSFGQHSYIDVTNAKSLTLNDCYADVDPIEACDRNPDGTVKTWADNGLSGKVAKGRTGNAAFIVSRSSSERTAALELTIKDSTILAARSAANTDAILNTGKQDPDPYSMAVLINVDVSTATVTGNIFGANSDGERYLGSVVEFKSMADGANLTISGNKVYGGNGATAFALSDAKGEDAYAAIFGENTVDASNGTFLAVTGKGHAQVYLLGELADDNYVNSNTIGSGKTYSTNLYRAVKTESDESFDFIAFAADKVETEGHLFEMFRGKVYLGTNFGAEHTQFTPEDLEKKVTPEGVTSKEFEYGHDIWIIDLAFEDPEGFVQHIADYTDHYYVNNAAGLGSFRDMVNGIGSYAEKTPNSFSTKTIVTTKDIDLAEAKITNWTPIGIDSKPFSGTFTTKFGETQYAIKNLSIDSSVEGYTYLEEGKTRLGLFGYTNGATLTYIKISGVTIVATNGLAGNDTVGALVGLAYSGNTINNITVDGLISITGDFSRTGGVIGQTYGNFSDITVNADAGSIVWMTSGSQADYVGGILGHAGDAGNYTHLTVNNLKVFGGDNVGGIAGVLQSGTTVDDATLTDVHLLQAAFETGNNTSGSALQIGAVSGSVTAGNITIKNVTFTGALERGGHKFGSVAIPKTVLNGGYSGGIHDATANPGTVNYSENNNIYALIDTDLYYRNGDYEIMSVHGLQRFTEIVAKSAGQYYRDTVEGHKATLLMEEDVVDLSALKVNGEWLKDEAPEGWTGSWTGRPYILLQIGAEGRPFMGTFDGNGKKITGLTAALFGNTDGATVKNLVLDGVAIDSETANVGGLINEATGTTLDKITVIGSVSGTYNVGGLIGEAHGATTISNALVKATVTKTDMADAAHARSIGVLVGAAEGTVTLSDVYTSEFYQVPVTVIDNQYTDGNLNYLVYNYGLVGSALSGVATDEWATDKGVLPAAAIEFDDTIAPPRSTGSINARITATDLYLTATYAKDGTASVYVNVQSAQGLASIAELVNHGITFAGETVMVGGNISMGSYAENGVSKWVGIGNAEHAFEGTFNGLDKQISHLYGPLFGNLAGTVQNLTLGDLNINKLAGDTAATKGTVAKAVSGSATIDNVTVIAWVQDVNKAGAVNPSDVAAAPFGLYEEGSATVVSSEITINFVAQNIVFNAKIDGKSNSIVTYTGDTLGADETASTHEYKAIVKDEIFRLGGFNHSVWSTTPTVSFTFNGIKFVGDCTIVLSSGPEGKEPNVNAFTMTNCYADVAPTAQPSRLPTFILGDSTNAGGPMYTVFRFTNNVVLADSGSATSNFKEYGEAIFSWSPFADGSVISGNVFGSAERPFHNAIIKVLGFEENMSMTIEDNTFFADGAHKWDRLAAIDLAPSQSTAFEVWVKNNTLNIYSADGVESNYTIVAAETNYGKPRNARVFITSDNEVYENSEKVKIDFDFITRGTDNIVYGCFDFVGYNVVLDDKGMITSGDFIFGNDSDRFATTHDADLAKALASYVADKTCYKDIHIVIGEQFGRRLSDLLDDNYNTYYNFSLVGLNSFASLVNVAGWTGEGKTVKLADELNKDHVLDLSSYTSWTPIGTAEHAFKGTFDGSYGDGNWTITNLSYSGEPDAFGFFGYTDSATVENLVIETVDVKVTGETNSKVGALVGNAANTTLKEIRVSGINISGNAQHAGAIVGHGEEVNLNNITVLASDISVEQNTVGAVIGYAKNATLNGVYIGCEGAIEAADLDNADVHISGANTVGGVVGIALDGGTFENIYLGSSVIVKASAINSDQRAHLIGAIIGAVQNDGNSEKFNVTNANFYGKLVRDTVADFTMTPTFAHYGLVGCDNAATDGAESKNVVISKSILHSAITEGFTQNTVWEEAKADSEYQVTSLEGFKYFRDQVNAGNPYKGEKIHLMEDLDLGGKVDTTTGSTGDLWTPIGVADQAFQGTFDGTKEDGTPAVISNIYVDRHTKTHNDYSEVCSNESYAGLFGAAGGNAKFMNFTIEHADLSAKSYVGAVVGSGFTSSFSNITVKDVKIYTHHYAGGLTGYAYGTFENNNVNGLTIDVVPEARYDDENTSQFWRLDNGDKAGGLVGLLGEGPETLTNNTVENAKISAYRDLGVLAGCYVSEGTALTLEGNTVKNSDLYVVRDYKSADGKVMEYTRDKRDPNVSYVPDVNVGEVIGRFGGTQEELAAKTTIENVVIHWEHANQGEFFLQNNAWHIMSKEGLETFRTLVNDGTTEYNGHEFKEGFEGETVYLEESIDLSASAVIEPASRRALATRAIDGAEEWTPIGTSEHPFRGVFDGQKHTVSDLIIKSADHGYLGFFGYVHNDISKPAAGIKNLTIDGVDIEVKNVDRVAALAGSLDNGGDSNALVISNITITGSVKIITEGDFVGSIAGHMTNAHLSNITVNATGENTLKSTGKNQWGAQVGGLVGHAGQIKADGLTSNLNVEGEWAGGLFGLLEYTSTVTDANVTANVTGTTEYVGGLVGAHQFNEIVITDSSYKGNLTSGASDVTSDAFFGKASDPSGTITVEDSTSELLNIDKASELTGKEGILYGAVADSTGEVTKGYLISSAAGLKAFAELVNGGKTFEGEHVFLTAEKIDLADLEGDWTPIGNVGARFMGTFDGLGHSISNIHVSGTKYVGLFGVVGDIDKPDITPAIKNLKIGGTNTVTITDAAWADKLGYRNDSGLLVGYAAKTTFANITYDANASVTVTAETYTLVGDEYQPFVGCGSAIGGLVGASQTCTYNNINLNCAVTVTAESGVDVGGLIGLSMHDTLTGVKISSCTVQANFEVGGVIGKAYGNVSLTNVQVEQGSVWLHYNWLYLDKEGRQITSQESYFKTIGGLVGVAYDADNSTLSVDGCSFNGTLIRKNTALQMNELGTPDLVNYGLVGTADYNGTAVKTVSIKSTNIVVESWTYHYDGVYYYSPAPDYSLQGGYNSEGAFEVGSLSVSSAEGLRYFASLVNGGHDFAGEIVTLENDVDLGGVSWTPIGSKDHPFNGIFEGNKNTVSGLAVDAPESDYVGLFGQIGQYGTPNNGTIQNLTINGATVVGNDYVGVVAGEVRGTVSNVTVKGHISVEGKKFVGGVVGHAYAGFEKVEVSGDETSSVSGETTVGGIVGVSGEGSYTFTCSVASVSLKGAIVGGIAGQAQLGNSFVGCEVEASLEVAERLSGTVGGIVGSAYGAVTVSGCNYVGSIVATNGKLKPTNLSHEGLGTGDYASITDTTVAVILMDGYKRVASSWENVNKATIETYISTAEALAYMAELVNDQYMSLSFANETVYLEKGFSLSEAWTPIGTSANPFRGHFDGKGNTISNLQVTGTYAGLFGYVAGHAASIENLTVSGATLTEVIENNEAYAGAVVAKFQISTDQEAKLSNLHVVDVHITAYRYAGGIVGQSYVAITNCSAKNVTIDAKPNQTGDTYDNGDKVGGIAGWFVDDTSRELKNNRAENITLTAYRDVGGIAGYAGKAIVDGNFVKGVKITVDQITNNYGDDKETNAGYLYGRINNVADWPKYVGTVEQGDGVEYSLTYNIKGSTALQSALNEASEYGSTTINLAEGTYEGTNNAKFGEKTITGFSIFADVRTASLSKDQYGNDKVYSRNIKNLTIQAMDNAEVTFTTAIVMHDGLDADADTHHTRLVSVDGVTVKGIKFDNASTPIFFINGYSGSKWSNITIENNTFTWDEAKTALNTDQIGVQMYSENFDVFKQGSEYRIFNVKVLNNTFTNAERPTYNCNISGFEFSGNTVNGYYFYAVSVNGTAIGGDVVVDGNTFYDPDNTTADNEGLIRGSILDGSLTFTNNKLYGITANKDAANGKQILISLQEGVNGKIYASGNKWFAANTPEEAGDASGYSIVEMNETLDTAKDSMLFRFYLELDEVEAKALKTLSADMSTHSDYFEGFTTITIVVNGEVDLGTEIVTINFGGSINFVGESEEISIINGMLSISAGGVTISNVTFRAETGTTEGNIILKVTAPTLDMTNCTVERTTGDAIAYGYILVATGDATLTNCTFIAPVKGSADEIHSVSPSVMEVKGQLTMDGGTISTNGYGLFSQHVTDATLTGVTFCGLERDYDGVTVKSLYMAINSIKINDITFSNCTIKDCRDWGMLLGGTTVTVEGCTFENSNADCGIVFYSPIANATIKGNTFNLQSGMDTIRFGKNSVLANTVLNIKNNTVNGGNEAVKFQVAAGETDLANVLACLNEATIDADVTVQLYEGTYSPTADNQFRLEANNVHLVGAAAVEGEYKTVIDALAYECSGQAGFEISGDNCSVENIKFVTSSANGNVAALKVTDLDTETAIVNGFSITDCEVVGKAGHALNLHGVDNVTVDGVKIGEHGKCGISIAKATKVLIKNTTFTDSECWADIGFMYKTGNAYITPCKVTVDFSTCTFAKNGIYSERPASADGGVDRIYDGAAIEGATEITAESGAPAGWTFANTASGWAMGKVEA